MLPANSLEAMEVNNSSLALLWFLLSRLSSLGWEDVWGGGLASREGEGGELG